MKQQSRTVPRRRQSVSPTPRHLPLVDILIDTQAELQELVVASGLKVLEAMLEEDRAAVCGPRYAHQPARQAYRTGHTPSQVVLGGRKVAIRWPRARRAGEEVPLPTARAFANADPLNRRVVDQMLIGVATRQYARSLDPLGADVTTRGTSKRAVSRRVVAQTQAQLDAWRATPLDALDLVGLLIDGVHVGGHGIVVARGIDTMGAKHPLGLWEGATENATVCQGLLTNLGSRGLRTDRSLLVIVVGAKALDTAVTQTFGRAALVQRCQVHKGRNILEHLPEAQRPWVKAVLTRAYTNSHVKTAKRLLQDLARRLDTDYPSAATSVREGLDETLTVLGVGLSERLQRSLATTNAIESLLSRTRHVQRQVKRWRGGTMVLRWVAAGVLEGCFRYQLLLPRPYLVLTKPLRLDIQCRRARPRLPARRRSGSRWPLTSRASRTRTAWPVSATATSGCGWMRTACPTRWTSPTRPTPWSTPTLGKTLKVRVTFDDDVGHTETLTSAATATVTTAAGAPGSPRNLSATVGVGQVVLVWEHPIGAGTARAPYVTSERRVTSNIHPRRFVGVSGNTSRPPSFKGRVPTARPRCQTRRVSRSARPHPSSPLQAEACRHSDTGSGPGGLACPPIPC